MDGKFYIGIDPGRNGAICVLDHGGAIVELEKMPESMEALKTVLESWTDTAWHHCLSRCVMERVQGLPGQSAPAAFNFGRNFGQLEAAVYFSLIPFETVTPQKWQQHFQAGNSRDFASATAWKTHLWMMAKKLYPMQDIKKYAGDAVLIARFCWEKYK